jgi:hypothetical protein
VVVLEVGYHRARVQERHHLHHSVGAGHPDYLVVVDLSKLRAYLTMLELVRGMSGNFADVPTSCEDRQNVKYDHTEVSLA